MKPFILICLTCMGVQGCMSGQNVAFMDDGVGVTDSSGACIGLEVNRLDLGEVVLGGEQATGIVEIELRCGESGNDWWSLDDPDQAFLVEEQPKTSTDLAILTVTTAAIIPGQWEAQLFVTDLEFASSRPVQLFYETLEQ
jgi:hypothetical protein